MSVNRDECGGRCLRLWERGSLPEVPGNVGRTRDPWFVGSGSCDFRDVALASNGIIFWIGRYAFVVDLWLDA